VFWWILRAPLFHLFCLFWIFIFLCLILLSMYSEVFSIVHFLSHYINQYGNENYPYNVVVASEMFFHATCFILFKWDKIKTPFNGEEKTVLAFALFSWIDGIYILFNYSDFQKYLHLVLGTLGTYLIWFCYMRNLPILKPYAGLTLTVLICNHLFMGFFFLRWLQIISLFHHLDAFSYLIFLVVFYATDGNSNKGKVL